MVTKSVSLTRKRELEKPDRVMIFLRGAFQFCIEHKTYFSFAVTVFLALICVFLGFRYYSALSEKKAFSALAECMTRYQTFVNEKGKNQAYLDIGKDFQTFLDKYSGRVAGKMAMVFYANMCYSNENYDKAIALYEDALKEFENRDMQSYTNLILSGLGYSYEGKKDYNKAGSYFEMVVSGSSDFMKDEAFFNLGRLYAVIGENEKSKKAFETIISDYSDSMYIELVKERLAM